MDYQFHEFPGEWPDNGQWYSVCSINVPGITGTVDFPREGDGFVVVDATGKRKAPAFARKKDAKRYAAKCVVHWLMVQGKDVKIPKLPGKGTQSTPSKATQAESKPGPAEPSTSTGMSTTAKHADDSDDEVSAVDRVKELCNHLGLETPVYKIVNAELDNFYNGYADFGVDRFTLGDTRFEVTNCFTKKGAKEQIAEQVLVCLLKLKKKREDQADAIFAEMKQEEADAKLSGTAIKDEEEKKADTQ